MEDSTHSLVEQLAVGLLVHPQTAADSLKVVIETARRLANAGNFAAIRTLADQADDAVEIIQSRPEKSDARLERLAELSRQVCIVLSYMGDSNGQRDSGYFRSAMAHAQRLDKMTRNAFRLVDLVNLIGD